MPVAPTYPGVYVQEIPSGVHTITGVSTSVTAFLGFFKRGEMNVASQLFSVSDLERTFGPLDGQSEAGYAVRQFFANGGTEAWVVRVAGGTPSKAGIDIAASLGGASILTATAASDGGWGANLRVAVDFSTASPKTTFNLTVTEVDSSGTTPKVVATELFRNLTLDPADPGYAIGVVNNGSNLIRLTPINSPATTARPAQTGTLSGDISKLDLTKLNINDAISVELDVPGKIATALGSFKLTAPLPTDLAAVAAALQTGIRGLGPAGSPVLPTATVSVLGSPSSMQFLQVAAGHLDPGAIVKITGSGTVVKDLALDPPSQANVQQYALGSALTAGAQSTNTKTRQGSDGSQPDATALKGNLLAKTGLFALENVDIFNILCIPDVMNLDDTAAAAVVAEAEAYCESRWAFYILDVPQTTSTPRSTIAEIKAWLDQNSTLRHKNAALYFPRPQIPDPLNGFRLKTVAPSGTIAGLYASIDAQRGVWKAPAGTEAVLRGVSAFETKLTDAENGTLNPKAINCLRSFPVYGNTCWGARTLEGDDQLTSEWKYIPVRRTALFIEESLYRGTKWIVFEPNDEPLWAQIRLNLGSFMNGLFRKGAFQGSTPQKAYFVKCDAETTTQNDINLGVVNIVVGFAPLKPAEFVIIQIQQIAGQIAS